MDRLISEQAVLDAICKSCSVESKPNKCQYRKGLIGGCLEYETVKAIPSAEPKKCKDCKWWRDSDGAYRRGVKAESKCPINTVSVANGWGYCYMYEPQESEDKDAYNR